MLRSTCMKTGLTILSIVVLSGLLCTLNADFRVISSAYNYTEIEFTLPEFETIFVENDGISYVRFYHPEHGLIMEEGLPELLTFSFLLSVPFTGTVNLDELIIKDTETTSGINLFPSQGFNLEIDEKRGFLKDKDFYRSDTVYPDKQVQISSPAIMRDMRLTAVNVTPFSYNPVRRELTTANKIVLRISYDRNTEGSNELTTGIGQRKSRAFERLQRASVINYDQFTTRNDYQNPSMIVVHSDAGGDIYNNVLNMFLNWKRDKGFEVNRIHTGDYPTTAAIQNYIQDAYDNWDNKPEYVVLFGDKSSDVSVPIWTLPQEGIPGEADGDNPYSLLAGDDLLPDVLVGRISVGTTMFDVTAFWNKLRNYERIPYTNQLEWYEHQVLVADTRPGAHNSGTTLFDTMEYVKGLMTDYNSDYDITNVYEAPFPARMQEGINSGAAFFSFRGTEAIAGWVNPREDHLHNGFLLPNADAITCRSMDFEGWGFTDRLFKMGTPTVAKGAISALGMSWVTDTAFNNNLTASLYRGLYRHDLKSMSEGMVYAKLEHFRNFWNSHQWRAEHYFQMLNLIGDPSMDVWKGVPQELNADYPEELPLSANSILINVTDSHDQPVEKAWVTIRKAISLDEEDIFATGYTDEQGNVVLYFDNNTAGEVRLTVTKADYAPYLGNFQISEERGVAFHELITNDSFDAGEIVNFVLSARNHRQAAAVGISGSIATVSEYVDIMEDEAFFGDIQPNANAQSQDDFVIEIAPETPAGHRAEFTLTLTDNAMNNWITRFSVTLNNGRLEVVELIVEDDDDGVLDPQETARLVFRLRNSGSVNLEDISAEITGGGYGLIVINNTAYYGDIAPEQTVSSSDEHFSVFAADILIPGMIFDFNLHLFNEEGYSQTIPVKLPIGTVTVDDPLGPCPYGYWIYDCGDDHYPEVPEYDWIEISPHLGGAGVNTGLIADYDNHQNSITMDLPFSFTFYGEEYDLITICANGWISFGETNLATRQNWRLPGSLGPDPIIAAFWDNLSLIDGWVYTFYDEEEDIFIIQWQEATNVFNDAEETFQIILYGPEYYQTTTGDAPVKIQYRVFNNVNDSGQEPGEPLPPFGEWGNYATIGIADHNGMRGLEYTFNNEYPTAARPLENETAIYITTRSIHQMPHIAIDNIVFTGENEIPHFGEEGSLTVRLINHGGIAASQVEARLTSYDEYVEILDDHAEFGDIEPEQHATVENAYTIRFAGNVPYNHEIRFNLSITADDDSQWNYRYGISVRSPMLNVSRALVYDPLPGGNNNGLIDPGEELTVFLPIKNEGDADSPPLDIVVTTESEHVEIRGINPEHYETIRSGEILYPAIQMAVSEDAPSGETIVFNYTFEAGEYLFQGQFILHIGDAVYVQLGSGNERTGPAEPSPINIYFRSLRSQAVYTAEEMRNAGFITGGSIMGFGFRIHSAPQYSLPNFTIRMKHTEADDVSEHIAGPYENVYLTDLYRPVAGGWDIITLDTPFEWNGVDNLLVDTSFSPVQGWSSSGQVRFYESENGFRFTRADGPDQRDQVTTTVNSNKPQAMIQYQVLSADRSTEVRSLDAVITAEEQVLLTWDAPVQQEGLLGYNVHRNGRLQTEEPITATEFRDSPQPTGSYYYYVTTVYEETGENPPGRIVMVNFDAVSIDDDDNPVIYETEMFAAYPNPFNPQTVIEFTLKESDKVTIEVFNILGQRVKVLTDDRYEAGRHRIVWQGVDQRNRRVGSGIYFYRMITSDYQKTGKVLMLK